MASLYRKCMYYVFVHWSQSEKIVDPLWPYFVWFSAHYYHSLAECPLFLNYDTKENTLQVTDFKVIISLLKICTEKCTSISARKEGGNEENKRIRPSCCFILIVSIRKKWEPYWNCIPPQNSQWLGMRK